MNLSENNITKGKRGYGFLLGLLLAGLSAPLYAAPIAYTYSGTWDNFFSGLFGPTYTATVVLDNGGTTVGSQVFTQANFVSATVMSGSYSSSMSAADLSSWTVDFTSNAAGQLIDGWFDASNAAGDYWHFDTTVSDEYFTATDGSQAGYFESSVSGVGVLVSTVPAPSALALLGLGLLGFGFRRKESQS